MTDADDAYEVEGQVEGELIGWEQPALVLRVTYDELGRVSTVTTDYRDLPSADELARIVAQFLTIRPAMANRVPGAALPRDPVLEREFRSVIGDCLAVANVLDPVGSHDNHECAAMGGHPLPHRCKCGATFGG